MKLPNLDDPNSIAGLNLNAMDDDYFKFRNMAIRKIFWAGMAKMFEQFPDVSEIYIDTSILQESRTKYAIRNTLTIHDYKKLLGVAKRDKLDPNYEYAQVTQEFEKALVPIRKQLGMKRETLSHLMTMLWEAENPKPFAIHRENVQLMAAFFTEDTKRVFGRECPGLKEFLEAEQLQNNTPDPLHPTRQKLRL
jgi:hypothetical protein